MTNRTITGAGLLTAALLALPAAVPAAEDEGKKKEQAEEVDYVSLAARLLKDGQIVEWRN